MSNYRSPGYGRWVIIGVGTFVFAVFAAVIWYAYVEVMGLGAGGPPPLVRAESGPIKRAPDDPGGMEIPNRDSAVARVFEEQSDGVRRERILPRQDTTLVPPEPEPVAEVTVELQPPAPTAPPASPTTPPSASTAPSPPIERLEASEPEPPAPPATTSRAPAPAARPSITVTTPPPAQPTAPRQLTPPPAAAPPSPAAQAARPPQPARPPPPQPPPQTAARTPAATPPARSAPVAGPIYRVQLGAFRSDAAANQAWVALQARLGAPLGGLRPTVLEASTSAGTFYRLQAGPLANRDSAVQTCSAIKAGGNDCFIVGPLP